MVTADCTREPEYLVKNQHLSIDTVEYLDKSYNVLRINVPVDIRSAFSLITESTQKFRIILRNKIRYDIDGNLINEFFINIIEGQPSNPVLTFNLENNYYDLSSISDSQILTKPEGKSNIYIAFDTLIPFPPYSLYLNGDLSIIYTLNLATSPTFKCKIIEADNALNLYETDSRYFYKPDFITEGKIYWTEENKNDNRYPQVLGDDGLIEIDCYKMVYKIPKSYAIPDNLEFCFKEFYFGITWTLKWSKAENKWIGDNCKGHFSEKKSSCFEIEKKNLNL
ncbi:hypothetical protein M9Y10_014786 [Tritrichomonas musculus]|uniref:Uncharacterized protein n=1 Tax=Tritrichomonas musculus TaxID=1915356 RepID=A0ABR2L0G6_9EUKA